MAQLFVASAAKALTTTQCLPIHFKETESKNIWIMLLPLCHKPKYDDNS
jgi:hypothetical protein